MSLFLLTGAMLVGVVLTLQSHPYFENCEGCKMEAEELMHNTNMSKSYDRTMHAGDVGDGGIVFTRDALHHGPGGILLSVDNDQDFVLNQATGEDVNKALKRAANEEEKAKIEAARKRIEVVKLEEDVADQVVHQRAHEKEMLVAKMHEMENLKRKKPEILAKQTVPIIVFAGEENPLYHHEKMILSGAQNMRRINLEQIRAQQKVTPLHDITDYLATLNPGVSDPAMYDKLFFLAGADDGRYYVPVSPAKGTFFIAPRHNHHHSPDNNAHSNLPSTDFHTKIVNDAYSHAPSTQNTGASSTYPRSFAKENALLNSALLSSQFRRARKPVVVEDASKRAPLTIV